MHACSDVFNLSPQPALPAHDEASKQETELERAEAECYVLKEKLEITEQNNVR